MTSRSLINSELHDKISGKAAEWFLGRPYNCGKFAVKHERYKLGFAVKALRELGAGNLLIVGGGTGTEAAYIKRRIPAIKITNTDISGTMVQLARIRAEREGLVFANEIANAEQMNYGRREFEFILISGAFHHIERQKEALAEMCRVASKGIIFTGEKALTFTRKVARKLGKEEIEYDGLYGAAVSPGWIRDRVRASGFRITRQRLWFSEKVLPPFLRKDRSSNIGFFLYFAFNMFFGRAGSWMDLVITKNEDTPDSTVT